MATVTPPSANTEPTDRRAAGRQRRRHAKDHNGGSRKAETDGVQVRRGEEASGDELKRQPDQDDQDDEGRFARPQQPRHEVRGWGTGIFRWNVAYGSRACHRLSHS
ncbi:MAG: hypothetical protein U0521_26150 [Anaerolineae bacterium]